MFLLADALYATAVIACDIDLSTVATDSDTGLGTFVRDDRYFSNDVVGQALIGEEMDGSVDLTPGHMFYQCITLLFTGNDVFSFRNGYTPRSIAIEKWRR